MIGLVTDSNSQMPAELAQRHKVEIVPIIVNVNGTEYQEGVDLDADAFYAHWSGGEVPEVSTSQPSPGAFAQAYQAMADRGAEAILSIHVGAEHSGTLNSARIGAATCPVSVRLVDTGTLSFGVSCCVWAAADALAAGADLEEAARVAEATAATVGTVFIVQAVDVAMAGGRSPVDLAAIVGDDGVPVISMVGDEITVVASGASVDELAHAMADTMHADGAPIRVALCIADATAKPFWEAMEDRLSGRGDIVDLIRYRVGPSVGAHTGPGTAGGFWYPVETGSDTVST